MDEKLKEAYVNALLGEDILGVVIRCHLFVEKELNDFLEAAIWYPEHLKPMRLDFSEKVYLAVACGMNPMAKSPLLAMGELRNKFAHNLHYELSKNDVDNFYDTFDSRGKEIIQKSFVQSIGKTGRKVRELPLVNRLALYMAALRGVLDGQVVYMKKIRAGLKPALIALVEQKDF